MATTLTASSSTPSAAVLRGDGQPVDAGSETLARTQDDALDRIEPRPPALTFGTLSPSDPRSALTALRLGPNAALRSNAPLAWPSLPQRPTWSVYNAHTRQTFTATDRDRMSVLMTPRADNSTVDYIVQRTREAGPRWLAEMNARYFVYEDERANGGVGPRSTYSAIETLQHGGVCRDQMGLMTAVLNAAGYRAHTVGYDSANTSHAVTLYQDPSTKLWGVIEYGRVHQLDAESPGQAMVRFAPGALAFDLFQESGFDRASVGGRFYTDRGLRVYAAMRGEDQPASIGQLGASAGTDGFAVTAPLGPNTNLFARSVSGQPGLEMQLGGVAHRFNNGARLTAGVGSLRFDERTVGPRELFTTDRTFAFVTLDRAGQLANTRLARGVTFEAAFDSALTLGFAPGDPSVTSAFVDLRSNVSATVRADVAPGLEAYGRGVLGIGTASAEYLLTDGRDIGQLPLNRRLEAGLLYTPSDRFFIDAGIEVPFGVQADNLHDRPALNLRGGALIGEWTLMAGARASLAADSELLSTGGSGVDMLYAGVERSFGNFALSAQAYTGDQFGERSSGASLSVRATPGALLHAIRDGFR